MSNISKETKSLLRDHTCDNCLARFFRVEMQPWCYKYTSRPVNNICSDWIDEKKLTNRVLDES